MVKSIKSVLDSLDPSESAKTFFSKFRYAYDGREAEVSDATGLSCQDPSLSVQDNAFENDPNTVMDRFARHGDIVGFHNKTPRYIDMIGLPSSYHEAMNVVASANTAFEELPARARERFDNDPGLFMEFISNPENKDEALKLGLLKDQLSTDPSRDPISQAKASVDNSSPSAVNPTASRKSNTGNSSSEEGA